LYHFYLSAYKIIKGVYPSIEVMDYYPIDIMKKNPWVWVQDFIAPFWIFVKAEYRVKQDKVDTYFDESTIYLSSSAKIKLFGFVVRQSNYEFIVRNNKITEFTIHLKNKTWRARWKESTDTY